MSAFIVNNSHIDALVTWAGAQVNPHIHYYFNGASFPIAGDEDRAGQVLVDQNVRSVNHRYNESDEPERYSWRIYPLEDLSPVQVIKACQCYAYQACETDDYDETEAAKIIDAIQHAAIRSLLGYNEADWEIAER